MDNGKNNSRLHCASLIAVAGMAVLLAGQTPPPARGENPASQPLSRPSAQSPPPASQGLLTGEPLPQAATPEAGLLLTEEERKLLDEVEDGPSELFGKPLSMLLARLNRLPPLAADEFKFDLDRPAYKNLLEQPQRYRGRPVRMTVQVIKARKLESDNRALSAVAWSKAGQPIWQLDCLNTATLKRSWQPMIVLMTRAPGFLGKPDKTDESGAEVYFRPIDVDIAAVFYRIYTAADLQDNPRDYPVLLAWQAEKAVTDSPAKKPPYVQVLLVVGVLLMVYAMIRARIKRSLEERATESDYRPRRSDAEEQDNGTNGQS